MTRSFLYKTGDLQNKMESKLKYGIQVTEVSPRCVWDIVVAFDIGTSYSGYAFCDRKEISLRSISLNQWTGQMVLDQKAKAPTTILYDKDKNFHSFGYEAEDFYARKVCQRENADWFRFRNFKMVLYREQVSNKISSQASHLLLQMTLFVIFFTDSSVSLYVRYLDDSIEKIFDNQVCNNHVYRYMLVTGIYFFLK